MRSHLPASAPPATPRAGTRLGLALLGYSLGIILVVTLAPFRFGEPEALRIVRTGGVFDLVGNVALFIPLGFLHRLTRPDPRDRRALRVLGMGLLLSAGIESAQLFEADRYASLPDVLTNGLGAWAGAKLHDALARRLRRPERWVGRLSLELPLMGLVYLLVPLLWLDSLTMPVKLAHLWFLLALGLFGGSLLAAMERNHFRPAGLLSPRVMALAALGWFLVGVFPALVAYPLPVGLAALAVAGWVWWRGAAPLRTTERRFEGAALRSAAPWLGVYLFLLAFSPLAGPGGARWSGQQELGRALLLTLLEGVAAFTVLGYVLAEARGRLELPYRAMVRRVLLWSAVTAAAGETIRAVRVGGEASPLLWLVMVGASVYGGWVYHLQREYVRALLAANRAHPPSGAALAEAPRPALSSVVTATSSHTGHAQENP